ncbi:G-type lectin S-receptor-like serine/threonine-kinase, partial [Trifolium pratense]
YCRRNHHIISNHQGSKDGNCSLGFFSPENSTSRYIGIWWKSQSTNVFVANRNQPLNDSNGVITISEDGNLVVLNGQKNVIWSSNVSNIASEIPLLSFWTTGNNLWQSIQHPSDTVLPGTKLSMSKRTGFEPLSLHEWNRNNWTGGCVRRTPLQYERVINKTTTTTKDGFLKLHAVKVPDFAEGLSVTPDICRSLCLENCSCTAYSNGAGIGCMSWTWNLIDIEYLQTGGLDLYFRVAHAELAKLWHSIKSTRATNIKAFQLFYKGGTSEVHTSDDTIDELLLFDFEKLATATNNFDLSNKIGQGGFGPVYKGKLQDGSEIAVKGLSRESGQGLEEFMNEVVVLCKLQHHNLVRLLGCCVDGKMLMYEYMRNKSLDAFIFG